MKRIFKDRARLVVYLEAEEMEHLVERAKRAGMYAGEYVRGLIAGSVAGLRRSARVSADEGRESVSKAALDGMVAEAIKGVCGCGHPKREHGGFKGACQEANCRCGGFR